LELHEAVAARIDELKGDITINKLASLSKIRQSSINNIYDGSSKNPGIVTISKICKGLNISLRHFFDAPIFDSFDIL